MKLALAGARARDFAVHLAIDRNTIECHTTGVADSPPHPDPNTEL